MEPDAHLTKPWSRSNRAAPGRGCSRPPPPGGLTADHHRQAVVQPCERLDAVELGRPDQGRSDRPAVCTALAVAEQAIICGSSWWVGSRAGEIGVKINPSGVQELGQSRPTLAEADDLGQPTATGRRAAEGPASPLDFNRSSRGSAGIAAARRAAAPERCLDVMQLANPLHRPVATDEFASCSLKNLRLAAAQQAKGSGGIIRQSLEPGIPVHIQDAAEVLRCRAGRTPVRSGGY